MERVLVPDRPDAAQLIQLKTLEKRLKREIAARQEAERLLEERSSDLYSTQEKLQSELLRAQSLGLAIESSKDGIAFTDTDGIFIYMNDAHAMMFGYEVEDLIGMSWATLYGPQELHRFATDIMPTFTDAGTWRGEAIGQTKEGTPVHQEVSLTQIPDGGIVCTTRDISELKRRARTAKELESNLRRAEQSAAISTVASAMAHDFNNLISAIGGYSHLLHTDVSENPLALKKVTRIQQATEQAAQIVKSIQDMDESRTLELEIVDLVAVVSESVSILKSLKPDAIQIVQEIPEFAFAHTNKLLLSRVIVNLVKNAFEAMDGSGQLRIRVARDPSRLNTDASVEHQLTPRIVDAAWSIEIIDDGHGIEEEHLSKIGDAGFSTKDRLSNSGLGLFSLKKLSDTQTAHVTIESAPGVGTRFCLSFPPVESQKPKSIPGTSASPLALNFSSKKICIAEDNPLVGEMLREGLEQKGYEVSWFDNPQKLLSHIAETSGEAFALLTDYNMPGLTGDKLAEKVNEHAPGTPVILFSGQTLPPNLPAEISLTLPKPVSIDALDEALSSLMSASQFPRGCRRERERK